MIRGFFARLIPIVIAAVLLLWLFRAPESVAGVLVAAVGVVTEGADALGRFASALTPALEGLL
ncbi:hypothetical protein O4J56_06890 [Nocardiopsis sp. RSe5-2]|uniref:Uncharacterized protein n=1 Tax=Nocardiopsis endophytica TaxID=3018445 RepID=A0ABT4U0A2_9ACTN|nr:hypothetical protein [Nocardiopsis endophytica]MDA2810361.1 hypothetical protein [Nocardiopsis endophytica]